MAENRMGGEDGGGVKGNEWGSWCDVLLKV